MNVLHKKSCINCFELLYNLYKDIIYKTNIMTEVGGIVILIVLIFTAGVVINRLLMYMKKKYNFEKVYADG